tara:strand:+ start:694 stop:900 length:207 start_codon:yes stop_codon:yes gene_type:complete
VVKIININTGEERETEKPKPVFCEICDTDINEMLGGVKGKIGQLPVAFCGICVTGIVNILMNHQHRSK